MIAKLQEARHLRNALARTSCRRCRAAEAAVDEAEDAARHKALAVETVYLAEFAADGDSDNNDSGTDTDNDSYTEVTWWEIAAYSHGPRTRLHKFWGGSLHILKSKVCEEGPRAIRRVG